MDLVIAREALTRPDVTRGSKLHIVLADDHALLRSAWKLLINSQPDMEVVGEADNGRTAVEAAILLKPACVVMDASMPEMDGVAATKWLATSLPEVTVVALTGHQDQGLLWQFLSAGAAGYVLKHSDPQQLLQAIRTVSSGGMFIDAGISSNRYRNPPRLTCDLAKRCANHDAADPHPGCAT